MTCPNCKTLHSPHIPCPLPSDHYLGKTEAIAIGNIYKTETCFTCQYSKKQKEKVKGKTVYHCIHGGHHPRYTYPRIPKKDCLYLA